MSESNDKANAEALKAALSQTDAELARVVEDLIHLLVDKGIIMFTDLPDIVQDKMNKRKRLREQLGQADQTLLSDSETI